MFCRAGGVMVRWGQGGTRKITTKMGGMWQCSGSQTSPDNCFILPSWVYHKAVFSLERTISTSQFSHHPQKGVCKTGERVKWILTYFFASLLSWLCEMKTTINTFCFLFLIKLSMLFFQTVLLRDLCWVWCLLPHFCHPHAYSWHTLWLFLP